MNKMLACEVLRRVNGIKAALFSSTMALALAACGGGDAQDKAGGARGGRGGPQGPAQVGFVVVQPTSAALSTELSARTAAYETSEVRPQVSGLIRSRNFVEGSLVRAGQTLYRIDPRIYQAQASEARANLQNAQASFEAAKIRADRFRPLAAAEAVSKQDYTDALATQRQAAAQIAQQRAQLQTAQVNVSFTSVPAPITGRIGRSLAQGDVMPSSAAVRLKLEDGSDYGYAGTVQFSEVTVDPNTGTVTLRARFPNPQGLLLPGMFVSAVLSQGVQTRAFLVPQPAVSRDPKGNATVYLVGPNNRAVQRTVVTERTQGQFWIVTSGLNPGDRVITQGLGRLKPNAEIRPVPANAPQRVEPPKGGQGGDAASKSR